MFPVFADGCCDIIFDLGSGTPAKTVSTGVELSFVPLFGSVHIGGIRFRPGGFTALTGMSADSICDGDDAACLLNRKMADGLKKAGESFLPSALDSVFASCEPVLNSMISFWLSEPEKSIGDITSYFGCSARTVNRMFYRHTGAQPAKMVAVRRFQKALAMVNSGIWRLTDIAYASGYYDQAHFIKDFRKYSGSVPSDFIRYKNSLGVRFIQFPYGCM
nr:helix-turn-helix transcriptional regulator [Seleniivibrio woodruffii]